MLAQFGSGDVFVDVGQEMDAGSLFAGQTERGELGPVQKRGCEIKSRAGGDDPFSEGEDALGGAPVGKREKAVGAGDGEERGFRHGPGKFFQQIDGVVWCGAGVGRVERGDGEEPLSVVRCSLGESAMARFAIARRS